MSDDDVLFSPVRVGARELRNRVVMLPVGSRRPRDGTVDADDVAWHRVRSSGVAAIVTGGTVAHPTSTLRGADNGLLEAFRRDGQEMQRRRAEAIHANGALVFGQILHLGRETIGAQSDYPTLAPSPVRSVRAPDAPHELTVTEIETLVEAFAISARMQEEAGADGVEIHAAHGYLVAQFLSAASNRREDAYGADRMRFLNDIVGEIRRLVRPDTVLGVRLSVDEEAPGGMVTEDTVEIARALTGVDYLSLTVGMRGAYVKDHATPFGTAVERAGRVKRATALPVLVGSRITTPALARRVLAAGDADLVGLARGLIADPRWVEKARAGQEDRIRPCVGFVQDCRITPGAALCAVNASAARERAWSEPPAPAERRRVAIAGGGPAGLEAARVAAEAGHEVVLYERAATLGGQWSRAAMGPGREELEGFVTYLTGELHRLGVEVHLGHAVSADELEDAHQIVLATGAVPAAAPFAFDGEIDVHTAFDVLALPDAELRGKRAVLADDGSGFWQAASAAEKLARAGAETVVVTPAPAFGLNIPHESIAGLHARLREAGVRYRPFASIERVEGHTVVLRDIVPETLAADVVVHHSGRVAETGLARELEARGTDYVEIGDCVAPRRLGDATFEANRAIRDWAHARPVTPLLTKESV